jgi:hypothetical protein
LDVFDFLDPSTDDLETTTVPRNDGTSVAYEELQDTRFKDRFGGVPLSVMDFDKDPSLLAKSGFDSDRDIRKHVLSSDKSGYAQKLLFSTYNPTQARLFLDYYMPKGAHVLDPFMGRGVRMTMALDLGMSYTGFDVCPKTVDLNRSLLKPGQTANLHLADGTMLTPFDGKTDVFDGVFTCPPYYEIEKYSGEPGDLSYLSESEFNSRMQILFHSLYRLVRPSGRQRPDIHPVVMTVGSVRRGEKGLVDMDYVFQGMAREAGFVLHDKVITKNRTPGAGFTFRRNWGLGFATKAHETTLVFLKRPEPNIQNRA